MGKTLSSFSNQEAERDLQISYGAFLDAAGRLQRQHIVIRPRQGGYVVVPPQSSP
jgi:hypothetical protein